MLLKRETKMDIKYFSSVTFACLAVVSFNAGAALVPADLNTPGDGLITRDTVTGLEWLDVTETAGLSYNNALTSSLIDLGFRYADNNEVTQLFNQAFDGYIMTDPTGGNSDTRDAGSYVDQAEDVTSYQELFGTTQFQPQSLIYTHMMYLDEDDILRRIGVTYQTVDDWSIVWGLDDPFSPDPNTENGAVGTFLVKDLSEVPIPAAVWLFGSGLIGLIGVARRKKA